MDYDEVMLFIKEHPGCTSLQIAQRFNVKVASSFTFVNSLSKKGLVIRYQVKSPTNGKRIFGYEVIPGFDDEPVDLEDESMPMEEIERMLKRLLIHRGEWVTERAIEEHNRWRRANGVPELSKRYFLGGAHVE